MEKEMGLYRKCAHCGKEFYMPHSSVWVYTLTFNNSRKYYCSWTCYRHDEKLKQGSTKDKIFTRKDFG